MTDGAAPRTGDVWWVWPDPVEGREQGGRRPAVIVASPDYLEIVDTLVMVVPISSNRRGWPNHIELDGDVDVTGWAMTEQVRTLSRRRLSAHAGCVSDECLAEIRVWLADFLGFPAPLTPPAGRARGR